MLLRSAGPVVALCSAVPRFPSSWSCRGQGGRGARPSAPADSARMAAPWNWGGNGKWLNFLSSLAGFKVRKQ